MSDTDELEQIREEKLADLGGETSDEGATEETTPESPIYVEDGSHLTEVVGDNPVVLAEFYADWCGPCKMLEPALEDVASRTDGAVAKIDVDANQQLAAEYGVRGVPTMVVFDDGHQVEQIVGMRDAETLIGLVEDYTAN